MSRAAKHANRKSEKRTTLKKVLVHLGLGIQKDQVSARDGIRSAKEFRAILDRERARVNRNGHEFSLVVFDLGNVNHNSAYTRHLVHVLSQRVRATDEIGWFDKGRIGVALPYTAPKGALKVGEDVCQAISTRAMCPRYTVYTYPSQSMVAGISTDPPSRFADISS